MDLAEMIDSALADHADGKLIIKMLIGYGHLPPDANERPAQLTARQCEWAEKAGGPS